VTRSLVELHLTAALAMKDHDGLRTWMQQAASRRLDTPEAGLSLLLARGCREIGDHAKAAGYAEAAVARWGSTYRTLADPAVKAAYVGALRRDLEAAAIIRESGRADMLGDVDAHFSAIDRAQQEAAGKAAERTKATARRARVVYGCAGASFLLSFFLGLPALMNSEYPTGDWATHSSFVGLAIMSAAAVIVNALLYPLWRAMPQGRPTGAWLALFTSLLPWLCLLPRILV
jgi:hypothetical protein